MYRKHGCEEGAASCDLILHTIEKTAGGDVCVVTAGVQCTMIVENDGKKMAQTIPSRDAQPIWSRHVLCPYVT